MQRHREWKKCMEMEIFWNICNFCVALHNVRGPGRAVKLMREIKWKKFALGKISRHEKCNFWCFSHFSAHSLAYINLCVRRICLIYSPSNGVGLKCPSRTLSKKLMSHYFGELDWTWNSPVIINQSPNWKPELEIIYARNSIFYDSDMLRSKCPQLMNANKENVAQQTSEASSWRLAAIN